MDLQYKIIERLVKKNAKLCCPLCESSEITTLQNSFVDLPIKDDRDGEVTEIKCMYTTCNKCGYITLFNVEVALT